MRPVFGRLIRHRTTTGAVFAHPVSMIQPALFARLVAPASVAFCLSANLNSALFAAIHLPELAALTDVERALAKRTKSSTKNNIARCAHRQKRGRFLAPGGISREAPATRVMHTAAWGSGG